MTTNSRLKQRARDYATEHGVSYTEARRILTTRPEAPTQDADAALRFESRPVWTIQQAQQPNGKLPYPFHIDEVGFVLRQDFWNGDPYWLVGLSDDDEAGFVTLDVDEFLADPQAGVGMYPVFEDRQGDFATYSGVVETVRDSMVDRLTAESVQAEIVLPSTGETATIGVGHLMDLLTGRDIERLREQGWLGRWQVSTDGGVGDPAWFLTGMLTASPGGQDKQDIERVTRLMSQTATHTPADIILDAAQAEAWVTQKRPRVAVAD